jgi:hypothetical protein
MTFMHDPLDGLLARHRRMKIQETMVYRQQRLLGKQAPVASLIPMQRNLIRARCRNILHRPMRPIGGPDSSFRHEPQAAFPVYKT